MNRFLTCVLSLALLALAIAPAFAGTWQGGSSGNGSWMSPANWVGGVVPPAGDTDDFGLTGDENVTLDGNQSAAGMTLEPWVGYNFLPGNNPANSLQLNSLQLPPSPVTLTVGDNIRSTSWTDYYIGPQLTAPAPRTVQLGAPKITADLLVPQGLNIVFQGADSGDSSLLLDGKVTGTPAHFITVGKAGNLQNASLWVTKDNSSLDAQGNPTGCSVSIDNLGESGAVHYIDGGNLGGGTLTINGGTLALHCSNSNNLGAPIVYNNGAVSVSTGKFFADRSYLADPTNNATGGWNAFKQIGGTFCVDNPGGDAQATFTGNNGFNFGIYYMDGYGIGIGNSPHSHTITVDSGVMTSGRGGFLVSSVPANGLNVSLTTVLGDTTGGGVQANGDGNYFDSGNILVKNGNGVLQLYIIDPANPPPNKFLFSTGPKHIDAGVLRFSAAVPAGTGQVLLNTRDSAVGVAFDGDTTAASFNGTLALAAGLTVPGQSGAFDLDLNFAVGYTGTQNITEDIRNTANGLTALRVGSSDTSGNANTIGIITPSTGANTYFLGGGGGTLTIKSVLGDLNNGPGPTALEMGTSGQLLPGRIILDPGGTSHQNTYTGATQIKAGTLQLATANAILTSASLSVGTYSTGFNGLYTGALNGEFNGPGQLLLDPGVSYFGPVNARTLDGGAVGWTNNKTIGSLPGNWGDTLNSTLNPAAAGPTNILHLGGEFSSGTMTKNNNWIIADRALFNIPVALVKSGPSILDLSPGGANTYSGGTSILGGEIKVSDSNQLGSGPIFLTNAGTLHVVGPTSSTFNQTLKLYGGATSGAGLVQVDGSALSASFTQPIDTTASPQSIVGIDGGGTLDFTACNVPYSTIVPNGNRWGLYLNNGTIRINQLPINTTNDGYGAQNGALVGNGGVLSVQAAPAGVLVNNPLYGFSSLATYQGTTTTINVVANTTLRINGSAASNFNGILDISNFNTGVVEITSYSPGLDASGNGTIDMGTGTLMLTQHSLAANASKLLPQSTGFTLKLNGGTFIGNVDGSINGNLIINNNGIGGTSVIQSVDTPHSPLDPLWVVAGSGLTSWNGTLDKEGPGTVQFNRCTGAGDCSVRGKFAHKRRYFRGRGYSRSVHRQHHQPLVGHRQQQHRHRPADLRRR